jgi:hypothetical protein
MSGSMLCRNRTCGLSPDYTVNARVDMAGKNDERMHCCCELE